MSQYTIWKTVSIRLGLLVAMNRIYEKTGDHNDRPTRVVGQLVKEYVVQRAKDVGVEIDDVVEPVIVD